jgi:SAM-dependent methyltransferase
MASKGLGGRSARPNKRRLLVICGDTAPEPGRSVRQIWMEMENFGQRDTWETLAEKAPLWAACTTGKRHVNWQIDDFVATGEREVEWAFGIARDKLIYPDRTALAVDFGCGPGRLTGALRESFQKVVGVDTSKTMLNLARGINPGADVSFSETAAILDNNSVDLIYSTFVLQHLTQDQLSECLREFARILHPKGLLVFQYPARPRCTPSGLAFLLIPTGLLNFIQRYIIRYPGIMPISWMTPGKVARRVAQFGLFVREQRTELKYSPNWKDVWYFVRKEPFSDSRSQEGGGPGSSG